MNKISLLDEMMDDASRISLSWSYSYSNGKFDFSGVYLNGEVFRNESNNIYACFREFLVSNPDKS